MGVPAQQRKFALPPPFGALNGLDVPTVLVSVLFFTQSALGQVTEL